MRNDHLIDTPIRLATCNRCGSYVFLAHASGVRAAADVAPADRDAYIAAVMDGRRSFDLLEAAGRPQKLLGRTQGSRAPSFDPGGAQIASQGRRKVLVEHGCGGHAQNMLRFVEVEQGPPSARVTPGSSHAGGDLRRAAHESGLTVEEIPRSPAAPVNRRLSERPPRCDICNAVIGSDEIYWGIQHGTRWVYAVHEECP